MHTPTPSQITFLLTAVGNSYVVSRVPGMAVFVIEVRTGGWDTFYKCTFQYEMDTYLN